MFRDKTIHKQVMKLVKAKIQTVQKVYEDEIKSLNETHEKDVEAMKEKLKQDRLLLIDKHVESIVGKLIS